MIFWKILIYAKNVPHSLSAKGQYFKTPNSKILIYTPKRRASKKHTPNINLLNKHGRQMMGIYFIVYCCSAVICYYRSKQETQQVYPTL
jgi:hypothetical protein